MRSEQTSEQLSKDGAGSEGVPGALTNQPPTAEARRCRLLPQLLLQILRLALQARRGKLRSQPQQPMLPQPQRQITLHARVTRNYEIDRTLAYTRNPPGRLQRLTVAVLIDNVRTTDKDGKVTKRRSPSRNSRASRSSSRTRSASMPSVATA